MTSRRKQPALIKIKDGQWYQINAKDYFEEYEKEIVYIRVDDLLKIKSVLINDEEKHVQISQSNVEDSVCESYHFTNYELACSFAQSFVECLVAIEEEHKRSLFNERVRNSLGYQYEEAKTHFETTGRSSGGSSE